MNIVTEDALLAQLAELQRLVDVQHDDIKRELYAWADGTLGVAEKLTLIASEAAAESKAYCNALTVMHDDLQSKVDATLAKNSLIEQCISMRDKESQMASEQVTSLMHQINKVKGRWGFW